MNSAEFRIRGKEMIDYICDYLETIAKRRVTPNVEPGYLRQLIPDEAPQLPEQWDRIMSDVEEKIMPGVTHWQHPRFHAYFPSGNSFPSILGDMLSDAIGCIGFSWAASPACTELETIVLNWFGKAIGLPEPFLTMDPKSRGGGVIQTSASECILVTMIAARAQAIKHLKNQHPFVEEGVLLSKLMAYCSKEAHSCVEKAAMICFVKLRILATDANSRLRGDSLFLAMEEDEANGLIPFFVSTTLGTTSCCSFDSLTEIGPVCRRFPSVWLHVDAAYAGNAFICPELKHLMNGIEFADSFNTNPNKWLLVNFDCSCLWVRDRLTLTSALVVDPLYLQHGYTDAAIDYRHWGVPLSRRFRSLKLWFVMRSFGISGLQDYIRHHCQLAKKFEALVRADDRFEICNKVQLGLVCFRLKNSNDKLNEKLLSNINASGKLHMVPALVNAQYIIRFCAVAQNSTDADIEYAWKVIGDFANELIEKQLMEPEEQEMSDKVSEMTIKKRKDTLAYKRSFFVRMVSDPKIYNPSIAKSIPTAKRDITEHVSKSVEDKKEVFDSACLDATISNSSWISWPLAFLFQGNDGTSSPNHVPLRFRHLDTRMRFTKKENGAGVSPEKDKSKTASPEPIAAVTVEATTPTAPAPATTASSSTLQSS